MNDIGKWSWDNRKPQLKTMYRDMIFFSSFAFLGFLKLAPTSTFIRKIYIHNGTAQEEFPQSLSAQSTYVNTNPESNQEQESDFTAPSIYSGDHHVLGSLFKS